MTALVSAPPAISPLLASYPNGAAPTRASAPPAIMMGFRSSTQTSQAPELISSFVPPTAMRGRPSSPRPERYAFPVVQRASARSVEVPTDQVNLYTGTSSSTARSISPMLPTVLAGSTASSQSSPAPELLGSPLPPTAIPGRHSAPLPGRSASPLLQRGSIHSVEVAAEQVDLFTGTSSSTARSMSPMMPTVPIMTTSFCGGPAVSARSASPMTNRLSGSPAEYPGYCLTRAAPPSSVRAASPMMRCLVPPRHISAQADQVESVIATTSRSAATAAAQVPSSQTDSPNAPRFTASCISSTDASAEVNRKRLSLPHMLWDAYRHDPFPPVDEKLQSLLEDRFADAYVAQINHLQLTAEEEAGTLEAEVDRLRGIAWQAQKRASQDAHRIDKARRVLQQRYESTAGLRLDLQQTKEAVQMYSSDLARGKSHVQSLEWEYAETKARNDREILELTATYEAKASEAKAALQVLASLEAEMADLQQQLHRQRCMTAEYTRRAESGLLETDHAEAGLAYHGSVYEEKLREAVRQMEIDHARARGEHAVMQKENQARLNEVVEEFRKDRKGHWGATVGRAIARTQAAAPPVEVPGSCTHQLQAAAQSASVRLGLLPQSQFCVLESARTTIDIDSALPQSQFCDLESARTTLVVDSAIH